MILFYNSYTYFKKNLERDCFLFCVASISGWIGEVIFRSLYSGMLVIPGFLNGPWCPIYGFGVVGAMHLCKSRSIPLTFLKLFTGATLLEWLTSWAFQLYTGRLLWDYTMMTLSIGPRINMIFSIVWGLLGIFLLYVIIPKVAKAFQRFPFLLLLSQVMIVFYMIDFVIKALQYLA